MLAYYLRIAGRNLRRSPVMTALMVLAIAVGVSASMTTLTVLRILSGDPLPGRGSRLYFVQLDSRPRSAQDSSPEPPTILSYADARALMQAHRARRQALFDVGLAQVQPTDTALAPVLARAGLTTADFLPMFGAPLRYGASWSADDDAAGARVAVISHALDEQLFGGADAVGRSLRLGRNLFRVVGVLGDWQLVPEPYVAPLGQRAFGARTDVFVPLSAAFDAGLPHNGPVTCWSDADLSDLRRTDCLWLTLWVQLDTPAQAAGYRAFLQGYSRQQHAAGRFQRPPNLRLRKVMQLLDALHVVPQDLRLQTWLAFGFLAVCVLNTVGLLLAKFLRRAGEIGVRRALGASRAAVFAQLLAESGVVGLAGGALGLVLTVLGLWWMRHRPQDYAALAHADLGTVALTLIAAVLASLCAGLLPAWRACNLPPALQLKGNQ